MSIRAFPTLPKVEKFFIRTGGRLKGVLSILQRSNKKFPLKPKKQKTFRKKLFGFDIETSDNNKKFVCASIVSDSGKKWFFTDKQKCVDFFKTSVFNNSFVVCSNMGFDFFGVFYDTPEIENFTLIFRGSQLIAAKSYPDGDSFKIKKTKGIRAALTFIDTMNYIPMSVKQLGKLIGLEKLEYKNLGKYPRNTDEWEKIKEYNIRDAIISLKFAMFLFNSFSLLGADIKMTIASTSMSLYRNKYLNKIYWRHDEDILLEQYEGYYGGRCEAFKRGKIIPEMKLKYYDINSLYPYVMKNFRYPDPNSLRVTYENTLNNIKDYEGMSLVSVECPQNLKIPLLPLRHDNKLLFPTGKFKGWYCHNELRHALELGYTIHKVFKTHYYKFTCTPFLDYVNDLYEKRLSYQDDKSPMEKVIKLCLNSLYGKFGEKFQNKDEWKPLKSVTLEDLDGKDFEIINNYVRIKEDKKPPIHAFPIWAAYVTAYGRMEIHNYLMVCDSYYCDTDSIMTPDILPTSSALGALKLEMNVSHGVIVKPKFYAFVNSDDKEIVKIKGIGARLQFDDFMRVLENKKVEYDKFMKFKESIRRGMIPNEIIKILKKLDLEDNKRIWDNRFNFGMISDSDPRFIKIDT